MKDARAALRKILLDNAAVNAVVTAGSISRIYPGTLPQGITLPSVVQNTISENMAYHMQGDDGLMASRIQLDAWALTQDLAVHLADLVFDCLSGFSGLVQYGSDSPQNTMVVRAVFHDTGRDDYDSLVGLYARRRDFIFWFAER